MAREVLTGEIGVTSADPRIAITRPDMSGPGAVEALGALGGEVIQGVQTGRALKGVQQDVDRFATVGEALEQGVKVDPNTGEVLEGEASMELRSALKRVQQTGAQKFREIALEVEQRGLYTGSMMARIHTEKTIRDLSMQTPGFEDEIRRTAASVLGYDPMGFGMRQILDVDKPSGASGPLTELDKWRQQVELATHQYNQMNPNNPTTYNKMDKFMSTTEQNNRSASSYESRVANGNASFEEILNSASTMESPLVGLYNIAQSKIGSGEGWDWKDTTRLQNEMDFLKAQYKQKMLRDAERTNPASLRNQTAMDRLDYTVNTLFEPYEKMISRSSITEFLSKKGAQMELQSQDFMRKIAPGLTMLSDGLKNNQAVSGQMMEIFYSVASDPMAALWIQQNPELRAIFGDSQEPMAWLQRSAERLGYGGATGLPPAPLANPEEERKQKLVDAQFLKEVWKTSTPEQRSEHLSIVAQSQPKLALGLVSADSESFNKLTEEGRLTVGKTQGVEIQAVIRDLADLQQDGYTSFQVNSSTGEMTAYRKLHTSGTEDKWDKMPVQPEAVRRYNLVHGRLYNDSRWRGYLTNNSITSGAEAGGLIQISASAVNAGRKAEEHLKARDEAARKYGSLIERGYKMDSKSMQDAKAEVEKYKELYSISQEEADNFNRVIKRLTAAGRASQ